MMTGKCIVSTRYVKHLAIVLLLFLCLVPSIPADGYVGGIPLNTVQSGTVSGGLYVDADLPSWGSTDVTKTFASIPSVDDIAWARLYVSVYSGNMQNNYGGTATVSFDGAGDGTSWIVVGAETLDTPGGYTYPGEGGTGPITVNDHCNRVTSDYLMWYNVTSLIASQTPKARVVTGKTDGSFDGRIKMITLVVAYNDGDTDEVYYWVNQGHDVDSYLADGAGMPYTGQTTFDLSSLSGNIEKATLVVNHLASTDGTYAWNGDPIPTDPSEGNSQGAFFGYNIWDLTSVVTPGESNDLAFNRTVNFYKIPLAALSVEKTSTPPGDLEVTFVNPVTGNVFAKEPNTVRITVKNNGASPSFPTEVRLTSSDGFDGRGSIPSIAAGQTMIVPVTDTTVRTIAGGMVTYTATVDPDNLIPETNEGNNEKSSISKIVRYNGYKGARYWEGKSDVLTTRTYDLRGDLLSSPGNSVYKAGGVGGSGWSSYTVTWTGSDIPLPSGATVREARLYVPYTWDDSQQIPDHFHLTFNGNQMAHEAHYTDKSNFGGYENHLYGLLAYNVTQWFNPAGNTALLSKDNVDTNAAMYGLTLAVVYEDSAAARRQVFLNEGFDILGADETQYGTTPEEATAYLPFSGMSISPGDSSQAHLTTFVPSGNGPEGDLLWNGVTIGTNVWDYGPSTGTQVAVDTRDVKSLLLASGNEAGVRSTATGATPVMAASHAFLVVEYPESGPVAEFAANVTFGPAPLTVGFTDESSGTITAYAWDFQDDGVIDSTEKDPVYTYPSQGTFSVNLTVTGPAGSASEEKTGFITVTGPSHPDLVITQISTNGNELFAHESNTVNATVRNNGTASAGPFTVRIDGSGAVYDVAIPGLDPGAHQQVQVTDTILRTMGDSVTITATADPDNAVAESDESNNGLSLTKIVVNNGYKGKRWTDGSDLEAVAIYEGRYDVVYSPGDSAYRSAKWLSATVNWTPADLPVPTGATILDARLYQPYSYNKMGTDPAFAASFNGEGVSPVATYRDIKGYEPYNYPYGLYAYDVTGFFDTDGNTLALTPEGTPGTTNDYALFGAYLVVIYGDRGTTEKRIWINEEFDMVYAGSARSVTSDEATAYAVFAGVDTTDMNSAEAVAVLASAGDAGKSKFFFNGNEYSGFWTDYLATPQIGFSAYDVTGTLASGENVARLQSYDSGSGGDNMYAMTTILVVEKAEPGVTADFNATPRSGAVPLQVTFTDESSGTITAYAWDFQDDGVIDSTEKDPVYTYPSQGTFSVNLTVTGPAGSASEVKTGYISATGPSHPDLVITQLSTNGNELFAHEPNTINATVRNNGTASAGPFTVRIDASGAVYDIAVPGLDPGAQQEVQANDTTLRTMGDSVTITATADPDNAIAESDESNNVLSLTKTVVNNGYKGKRWTDGSDMEAVATFEGRVGMAYSTGDAAYRAAGWTGATTNWTSSDLPIPTTATILHARLYQGYTFDQTPGGSPVWTTFFNGQAVIPDATYTDRKGYATFNYPSGLFVYDVTGLFDRSGNALTVTPGAGNNNGLYGSLLVVVYQDSGEPVRKIILNEECDILYAGAARFTSDEEATAYAPFGSVVTAGLGEAHILAILFSANEAGKSAFIFNGQDYGDLSSGYLAGPQVTLKEFDVTDEVSSGENTALFRSVAVGASGDNMVAAGAIFITEYTEAAPAAAFTASPQTGTPPLSVQFNDESTGTITSRTWDFGDGNTSVGLNPSHTYTLPGTYTVNLTVTGPGGSDSEVKANYITVTAPPVPPVARFTANPTSGTAPLSIQFTDQSTGSIAERVWEFRPERGVWTAFSTASNPSHTFTDPATYDIRLTVRGPGGESTEEKMAFISVLPPGGLRADFSASPTSGFAPLSVTFTDQSTGAVTLRTWDFNNDGRWDSISRNPTYRFWNPGVYTIRLAVSGPDGSDEKIKEAYIAVTAPMKPPIARFTQDTKVGNAPLTVRFTDLSTGSPESYLWTFGDGGSSTDPSPVHTYQAAGLYRLTLRVENEGGTSTATGYAYVIRPFRPS